jgi:membrane-bound lytic murein transglycosylase B
MTRLCHFALLSFLAFVSPATLSADFTGREDVREFAREMGEKHGFAEDALLAVLEGASSDPRVIRLVSPPAHPGVRSWRRYRARFIEPVRIERGLEFWEAFSHSIRAASERFGVPEEIIVAIIGVETIYGRNTGNFQLVSALATLAFDYPPRAPLFRKELEHLFLLAQLEKADPASYRGSYAGAIGYPQFLPSSVLTYAVDFDEDGQIDVDGSPIDAIGSVANYLHLHGWVPGAPVAVPALVAPGADLAPLLEGGIVPSLEAEALARAGVTPATAPVDAKAALVDLVTPGADTEYWLGFHNFYVITRYNRSSFYAMSVFQLAQKLRERRLAEVTQASAATNR